MFSTLVLVAGEAGAGATLNFGGAEVPLGTLDFGGGEVFLGTLDCGGGEALLETGSELEEAGFSTGVAANAG